MSGLLKNLLLALAAAALIWMGYVFFIQDPTPTATSVSTSQAAIEAQDFLSRLRQLESVRIEGTIFTDTRFRSLTDFRQPLVPEPVGRTNPFTRVR